MSSAPTGERVGSGENRVLVRLARAGGFALEADLHWPAQGVTALFGPSGAGKTTLLRCVAGLEKVPGARVEVNGDCWQDDARGIFVPAWQRPVGVVFQEASLFEHLDVRGNLAFASQRAKPAGRDGMSLEAAIALLGIGGLLGRRAHELSGGERQRVAIARALATQPRLLLLDEPLAALDAARRQEILPWLERLRDELRIPMLYVTHSADEMARLADTLVLLDQGRIVATGALQGMLGRVDLPLARDENAGTVLPGVVHSIDAGWHLAEVDFGAGALWVPDTGLAPGAPVRVRVLARDVSLALEPPAQSSIQNVLPCEVRAIAAGAHASQALVQLAIGKHLLLARVTARAVQQLALAPGRSVWAQVKSAALVR